MKDLNRARMMNQLNKAAWLQLRVEDGSITSHSDLLQASTKIYASGKIFAMVQDYFGTKLPAKSNAPLQDN